MEIWDLYTAEREKTGKTMLRGEKCPDGYYRLTVHVCIFNDKGEMLIQQRQPFKDGWPDKWDISVGGSAVSGETSRMAAERETLEELGLKISLEGIRPALTVHFATGINDIYTLCRNVELSQLRLQPEEVQNVRWAASGEILRMIDEGSFIPYHKGFIELLFWLRDHRTTHTNNP